MQVVLRHGEEALAVSVPDKWKVRVIRNTSRPLTRAEIAGAIDSPIDSPSLEQLARRRSTAAIIVEDHTRPAYVGDIVLEVLDRLNRGGIADDNIVLVGATGAHRSMEYTDFVKKIGPDVVARVRVESHDPFGPCERIGFTSRGTPVELNRTVVSSDLKLAVGSVLPHGAVRFGGGAKLVLPGVASYRTIVHNHNLPNDPVELDGGWQRPHRLDMEEAARMLGLDFYIGFLLDMDVNICRVAAGDMVSAHRWLMERAGEVYGAEMEPLGDVVVACAWPLDLDVFQCGKGLFPAVPFVKLGGTLVWAARCPEGRGCHHLV
ncbi:MAG: lactate racemase domain-containing protein, partial [Bacillota bacterium]